MDSNKTTEEREFSLEDYESVSDLHYVSQKAHDFNRGMNGVDRLISVND